MITEAEAARNREYEKREKSKRTQDAYDSHWGMFEAWCGERTPPEVALPANPEVIKTYLTYRAETRRAGTADSDWSAILDRHARAGFQIEDARLTAAVKGIRRQRAAEDHKQAAPFTIDLLDRMAASPCVQPKHYFVCELLFGAALRVSELTALRVGDIRFLPSGNANILIRRSKTDQTGRGARVTVGPRTAGILRTLAEGRRPNDPLITTRKRRAVTARYTVQRWVRAAVAAIGEDASAYSTHSGRVGAAIHLKSQGFDLDSIARFGRWNKNSLGTVAGYLREFDDDDAMAAAFG